MRFMFWRTMPTILGVFLTLTSLSGCSSHHEETHHISIGFVPGPYRDEFEQGVAPQLEKEGYQIEYKEFSDGDICNDALARGEIDANVMQHRTYLASTNTRNGTHLRAVVEVPTPPMGLFSTKHQTIRNPDHATVAVPDTPVNLLRALRIMRDAGWLTFNENAKPDTISPQDIISNPHHIKLLELDAAQGPRSLEDADYAAIQGNFVVSAGLKLSNALALEQPDPKFINIVAVNEDNLEKPFVKAIVNAYRSPFFQKIITTNPVFNGYMTPEYFKINQDQPNH